MISKIYKELQLNIQQKLINLKMVKNLNRHFSKKDTPYVLKAHEKMININNHEKISIKTTMKYSYIPIRMSMIRNNDNNNNKQKTSNIGEDMDKRNIFSFKR